MHLFIPVKFQELHNVFFSNAPFLKIGDGITYLRFVKFNIFYFLSFFFSFVSQQYIKYTDIFYLLLNVNITIVRDRLRYKSSKANSKSPENAMLHRKVGDIKRNLDFGT